MKEATRLRKMHKLTADRLKNLSQTTEKLKQNELPKVDTKYTAQTTASSRYMSPQTTKIISNEDTPSTATSRKYRVYFVDMK